MTDPLLQSTEPSVPEVEKLFDGKVVPPVDNPDKDMRFVTVIWTPQGLLVSKSSDKARVKSVAKERGLDLMDQTKCVVLRGKILKAQRHTYTTF